MLKNHLKIAIRNLWKRKALTVINIIGLSLGLASVMTLGLLIYQFYTTDDIQLNRERMVYLKTFTPDGNSHKLTPFPLLYEIQKTAPEVEAVTHIQSWNWPWLKYGNRETKENTLYADTGFFKVFSFKLKQGNPVTALNEKFNVVISEKLEKQLFGEGKGLGKIVMADDSIPLTVTGILDKIPSNSTIKADVFLPMALLTSNKDFEQTADWYNTFAENYLLLGKDADKKQLDKKISTIIKANYPQEFNKVIVKSVPFTQIKQDGDANVKTIIMGAIASSIFILLIVIVNLLNLNAAAMFSRIKEVALRQMIGSGKKNIIAQFCIENALVMLVSLLAGFLFFLNLMLPQVNTILNPGFGQLLFQWNHDYIVIIAFSVIALLVIFIAGSYPAIYLTSVKVSDAIKGNISIRGNKKSVRNIFISLQFTLAIILICAAIILNKQIGYMKMASPGFDKDNLIVIDLDLAFRNPTSASLKFETILNSLKSNPYVKYFSTTPAIPTHYQANYNEYIDVATSKKIYLRYADVDAAFTKTYQIPLLKGRNFNDDLTATEVKSIMLNETAVKAFGWKDPIGKQIKESGSDDIFNVIGVIKDFHYSDLQQPIEPLLHGYNGKPGLNSNSYLSVNLDMQHSKEILAALETEFKDMPTKRPFTYHYMNDLVGEQYNLFSGILRITNYVAFLTIGIACMGMFGLVALSTKRRVKEIGIRKVLGANLLNITALISKDFMKIILISIAIASPIAWYMMNRWLQDFAFHIQIQWWMFALAGFLAVLIALLTVGFQSIKAALANPVKSLRTE